MASNSPLIELPSEIYEQCLSRIEGTEFNSVEEYVVFVMGEIFEQTKEAEYADEDYENEEMEERLESLGYL